MRMNLVLGEELVNRAKELTEIKTTRGVVLEALAVLVQLPEQGLRTHLARAIALGGRSRIAAGVARRCFWLILSARGLASTALWRRTPPTPARP